MRPWRLTRRARVEMESALAGVRRAQWGSGVLPALRVFFGEEWQVVWGREPRILRARVALALRAALRADEDARCEEAWEALYKTGRLGYYQQTDAYNGGLWDAMQALREWMPVGHGSSVTPRALWEVAR